MKPIPSHLLKLIWYASIQEAIRERHGSCRHDPEEAEPQCPDLRDANLRYANLRCAVISGSYLRAAIEDSKAMLKCGRELLKELG